MQLFFIFYFVAPGVHALHLMIGVSVLLVWRCGAPVAQFSARHAPLNSAGLYWHFVDLVWIFLYALIYLPGRDRADDNLATTVSARCLLAWPAGLARAHGNACLSATRCLQHTAVALGIGATKAAIVAALFMELWHRGAKTLVFATAGLFWLAILLWLGLMDFMTRT